MSNTEPIFTTKGRYSFGYVALWIIIISIIIIAIALRFSGSTILFIIAGLFFGIPLIKNLAMYKSFLSLYSDRIIGVAIPENVFSGLNDMHVFELSYREIDNVEYKKSVIILSANSRQYQIQAKGCEQEVVAIITIIQRQSLSKSEIS